MLGRVVLGLAILTLPTMFVACGETKIPADAQWRCTQAAIACYRQCERYRCSDFVRCDRTCMRDAGCPGFVRGVVPPLRAC